MIQMQGVSCILEVIVNLLKKAIANGLGNRVPAKVGDEKLCDAAWIMKKVAILMGLKIFDVIFRSSDRMDTEFTGDFYFDFCRMSNSF